MSDRLISSSRAFNSEFRTALNINHWADIKVKLWKLTLVHWSGDNFKLYGKTLDLLHFSNISSLFGGL